MAAGWIVAEEAEEDEVGGRTDEEVGGGGGGGGDVGDAFVLGGDDQWCGCWCCCCCCCWCSAPVGEGAAPRGAAVDVAVVIQCGGRYIDIRAAERKGEERRGEKSSFSSSHPIVRARAHLMFLPDRGSDRERRRGREKQ